jgi:hypothetical protein
MLKYSIAPAIYSKDDKDQVVEKKILRLSEWPNLRDIAMEIHKLEIRFAKIEIERKSGYEIELELETSKEKVSDRVKDERSMLWLDLDTKKETYRLISGLNYSTFPSLNAKQAEKQVLYIL